MRIDVLTLCISGLFLFSATADAHTPHIDDGMHTTPESAFALEDIEVSRVLYSEVRCPNAPLWIRFDGRAGDALFLQLGIPALDSIADFRPRLALLGPDLPPVESVSELPFELPAGLGARVFDSSTESAPEFFFEPFSRTSSWILVTRTVELPATGVYYLVAFSDENIRARLWVTTGTREEFSLRQVLETSAQIQRFHQPQAELGCSCSSTP